MVWPLSTAADITEGGTGTVSLENLNLPPDWYRVKVWTSEAQSAVAARARFLEGRRADLRIRMEPAGKKCFQKIFKIAEPLSSLSITLSGEPGSRKLRRIELRALNRFSITWFLATKAARYALSNRRRFNWKTSWSHLLAALHPRGNFAFRGRYDRPGNGTYEKWRMVYESPDGGTSAANALRDIAGSHRPRLGLLVGSQLDASNINKEIVTSLIGSTIELCVVTASELKNLSGSDLDFILPVDYKGLFPSGAVERLVLGLLENTRLAAVFADSDFIMADGTRQNPRLKPPWDRELLWCADYIRAPLMVRWASDLGAGLDLSGADLKPSYALALTLLARRPRESLGRIPAILFHQSDVNEPDTGIDRRILEDHLSTLQDRTSLKVLEDGTFKVDWLIPAARMPRVSIIIPSKDNFATLKTCIESIIANTAGVDYEIIIADNGSSQRDTVEYLSTLPDISSVNIIRLPGPFNFSKINNDARGHATGEILVFLNDDTKIVSGEWLFELVSVARRREVGAVGALLLYPDGSVQHAGVLLGVGGPADHAFRYLDGNSPGYLGLLRCRREVTAVTGACLAVSASHFDAVGGFDEMLMVTCNDVDLCLRLRAMGLVNVLTPWARLEHWESMTRGVDFTDEALERQADELRIMSERWGALMDRDPTYHPGLSDFEPNYCLSV
ncbi:MAG: glycosyl transferase family 2 [Rhodospirillales bacterium]|nr:glycosyl transferase family 2 [Rhodospirillales bacterium]